MIASLIDKLIIIIIIITYADLHITNFSRIMAVMLLTMQCKPVL